MTLNRFACALAVAAAACVVAVPATASAAPTPAPAPAPADPMTAMVCQEAGAYPGGASAILKEIDAIGELEHQVLTAVEPHVPGLTAAITAAAGPSLEHVVSILKSCR